MYLNVKNFKKFLAETEGAITVDYVVLTAAATAVAVASSGVVQDGLRALAGTVDGELSGEDVDAVQVGLSYSDGFDNGADGWFGASANAQFGIGTVLGPIGGSNGAQSVSREFSLVPGVGQTTISFDLYAMDSFDNDESGIIFIDGQEVGRVVRDHSTGQTDFVASDVDGVIIRAELVEADAHFGGNDAWTDSLTSISITVDNPDENLTVGFGSTTNQGVDDESLSIDNFSITGLADPDVDYSQTTTAAALD